MSTELKEGKENKSPCTKRKKTNHLALSHEKKNQMRKEIEA